MPRKRGKEDNDEVSNDNDPVENQIEEPAENKSEEFEEDEETDSQEESSLVGEESVNAQAMTVTDILADGNNYVVEASSLEDNSMFVNWKIKVGPF